MPDSGQADQMMTAHGGVPLGEAQLRNYTNYTTNSTHSRYLYLTCGPLVERHILLCGGIPGMIFAHAAGAQDWPASDVAEAGQAALDRRPQIAGGVVVEAESVAVVALAHGIGQPARSAARSAGLARTARRARASERRRCRHRPAGPARRRSAIGR